MTPPLLGSLLGRAKDRAISAAAGRWLGSRLANYGKMLNFSIDTQAKTISVEVHLRGEPDPVRITLSDYQLSTDAAGKTWLKVGRATASREWLGTLLAEAVVGRALELPPQAAPWLKMLA